MAPFHSSQKSRKLWQWNPTTDQTLQGNPVSAYLGLLLLLSSLYLLFYLAVVRAQISWLLRLDLHFGTFQDWSSNFDSSKDSLLSPNQVELLLLFHQWITSRGIYVVLRNIQLGPFVVQLTSSDQGRVTFRSQVSRCISKGHSWCFSSLDTH